MSSRIDGDSLRRSIFPLMVLLLFSVCTKTIPIPGFDVAPAAHHLRPLLPLKEFIDSWMQHVPAHYQHTMRYFGLFAPRSVGQTASLFRHCWPGETDHDPGVYLRADSIRSSFGTDPLLDQNGRRMVWVRRLVPKPLG